MPDLTDLLQAAGRIAVSLQSAPPGVPERLWREVQPWLTRLVTNATSLWIPVLTLGRTCEVLTPNDASPTGWVPCLRTAIAICDVCRQQTCLHHCRVDSHGQVICFECVGMAYRAMAANPRPPPYADPRRPRAAPPDEDHQPGPRPRQGPRQAPQGPPRTMTRATAFRVLKLKSSATPAEIKAAHRRLSKEHHPDRNPGHVDEAAAKFRQVQEAYEILTQER